MSSKPEYFIKGPYLYPNSAPNVPTWQVSLHKTDNPEEELGVFQIEAYNENNKKYLFMGIWLEPRQNLRGKGWSYKMMHHLLSNLDKTQTYQNAAINPDDYAGIDIDFSSTGEDETGPSFWNKFLKESHVDKLEKGEDISEIKKIINNKLRNQRANVASQRRIDLRRKAAAVENLLGGRKRRKTRCKTRRKTRRKRTRKRRGRGPGKQATHSNLAKQAMITREYQKNKDNPDLQRLFEQAVIIPHQMKAFQEQQETRKRQTAKRMQLRRAKQKKKIKLKVTKVDPQQILQKKRQVQPSSPKFYPGSHPRFGGRRKRRRRKRKTKRRRRKRKTKRRRKKRRGGATRTQNPEQFEDMVLFMMATINEVTVDEMDNTSTQDIHRMHIDMQNNGQAFANEIDTHFFPRSTGYSASQQIPEMMIAAADQNGDGRIEWNELMDIMIKIWEDNINPFNPGEVWWAKFWDKFAVAKKGHREYHSFVRSRGHEPYIPTSGASPLPPDPDHVAMQAAAGGGLMGATWG